jgi:hypothetical protein
MHRISAVLRVKVCRLEAFHLQTSFFSATTQIGPRPPPLTFLCRTQLDTHTHAQSKTTLSE